MTRVTNGVMPVPYKRKNIGTLVHDAYYLWGYASTIQTESIQKSLHALKSEGYLPIRTGPQVVCLLGSYISFTQRRTKLCMKPLAIFRGHLNFGTPSLGDILLKLPNVFLILIGMPVMYYLKYETKYVG